MSLRGNPVVERVELPDGRTGEIRVAVPDDSYIAKRELDTVALELRVEDEVVAALNTVLDPDQTDAARQLARKVAEGLRTGRLEPTAGDLEPLADELH